MTTNNINIPNGWSVFEFDNLAQLSKQKYYPNKNEHLQCLELEHFEKETGCINGFIDSSSQSSTKNIFKKGDILFGKLRPYLKKYTKAKFDGVCSTEIWVLNGKHNFCYNDYLYLLVQTNKFNNICNVSSGTHMPRADWSYVSSIPFLLPPLAEQEKIAEVLSCWDEAIEKLTEIISLKKEQKKGLMQKLLTGKTHLSGFTQPWKTVKLDEICNIKKGQQLNKLDMKKNANYPVLNGGIDFSGYTTEYNTKANTITISEGGNSCGFINFIKQDFWAGGHCYVIDNIQISKEFLFQSLKLKETKIMHLRVGSGLPNIQLPSLKKYKITISSDIAEQKAIADILQSCDLEIEKLKTKLDLLKLQKKGLMQQLLTGKIRVKINK